MQHCILETDNVIFLVTDLKIESLHQKRSEDYMKK